LLRLVRELARASARPVEVLLEGRGVELDQTIAGPDEAALLDEPEDLQLDPGNHGSVRVRARRREGADERNRRFQATPADHELSLLVLLRREARNEADHEQGRTADESKSRRADAW